jgi:DNA-binding transcriptional LysR family regulator
LTPTATSTFRVAASDYLDPLFLPQLVAQIKAQAPLCQIEIHPLSAASDYQAQLAQGEVDVVMGNWLQAARRPAPGHAVCRRGGVPGGKDHPAVRRGWTAEPGWKRAHRPHAHPPRRPRRDRRAPGKPGPARNITARCPHFGLIPAMVASSLLVLTTGRQYCERFTDSCR